eukprot:92541_1
MEHLIRFRMLANELDNTEFCQFLSQLVTIKGRDLLLHLLFTHFVESTQSNDAKKDELMSPFINIITRIITNRDKSVSVTSTSCTMSELPSALISETASYLKATEYIVFSRCNRKIYVSCNSPCKIFALPTMMIKKYPLHGCMKKFQSLKQLGLNIKYFNNKISRRNQSTWHNVQLHTLQLSNRGGNENDCMQFIERNLINNTQNLKLHKFGKDIHNKFDSKSFCDLLCNFRMIEHLLLWDVFLQDNQEYIENEIKEWLPNLKGFGFTGGSNERLSHCIISALSDQLEALRIEGLSLNYHNVSSKSFPKLKELSLSMCNLDILSIFKHVDTLNSVMISSSKEEIIKEFINIMISKRLMKHIHIKSPAKLLKFAMEQTEKMLFNTKHIKRCSPSLQIIFDGNNANWDSLCCTPLNELHLTMFRLINALEKSQIENHILRIKMSTAKRKEMHSNYSMNEENNDIKKWLSILEAMKTEGYLIHHQFSTKKSIDTFIFTVSNRECKVNGFRYLWKMWSSSL